MPFLVGRGDGQGRAGAEDQAQDRVFDDQAFGEFRHQGSFLAGQPFISPPLRRAGAGQSPG